MLLLIFPTEITMLVKKSVFKIEEGNSLFGFAIVTLFFS